MCGKGQKEKLSSNKILVSNLTFQESLQEEAHIFSIVKMDEGWVGRNEIPRQVMDMLEDLNDVVPINLPKSCHQSMMWIITLS